MFRRLAFSLIELMVVIVIVAILAVVAVPAYKQYIAKTNLSVAMNGARIIVDDIINQYLAKGDFFNPLLVTINGVNLTGAYTQLNGFNNIYMVQWDSIPSPTPSETSSLIMQVLISNLEGMPNYQDPSMEAPWSPTRSQVLYYAIREIDGFITVKCGTRSTNDSGSVPLEFAKGCTCNNTFAWAQGGSC